MATTELDLGQRHSAQVRGFHVETPILPPVREALQTEQHDPHVEMLDITALSILRKNGTVGGKEPLFLESLHRYGFGDKLKGGAIRRDPTTNYLYLDLFVDDNPEKIKKDSHYGLPADLNVNPWAKPGENPFEARVTQFLGDAPTGDIKGMVAEEPPVLSGSTPGGFVVYDAWGLGPMPRR